MLQKVDKDRLDKVLSLVELNKIRFPVAELSKKLGKSKGEISDYLSGKKPMSNNFYNAFIELYNIEQAKPLPATESFNQNEVSLHSLIESNRVLVETNKVLTELLQQSFSLSSAAQSSPGKLIDPYTLELLARRGVPEYWATIEEGRLKLGSIASALKTVKK